MLQLGIICCIRSVFLNNSFCFVSQRNILKNNIVKRKKYNYTQKKSNSFIFSVVPILYQILSGGYFYIFSVCGEVFCTFNGSFASIWERCIFFSLSLHLKKYCLFLGEKEDKFLTYFHSRKSVKIFFSFYFDSQYFCFQLRDGILTVLLYRSDYKGHFKEFPLRLAYIR